MRIWCFFLFYVIINVSFALWSVGQTEQTFLNVIWHFTDTINQKQSTNQVLIAALSKPLQQRWNKRAIHLQPLWYSFNLSQIVFCKPILSKRALKHFVCLLTCTHTCGSTVSPGYSSWSQLPYQVGKRWNKSSTRQNPLNWADKAQRHPLNDALHRSTMHQQRQTQTAEPQHLTPLSQSLCEFVN